MRSNLIRPGTAALAGSLVLVVLATAACDDTGMLVLVQRNIADTPAAIEQLRLVIGSGPTGDDLSEDGDPLRTVSLPEGRDLAKEPYRLLLRDGDQGDTAKLVMVAAFGYVGGNLVAAGRLDAPRPFVSGQIVQWELMLRGSGGDVALSETGCVFYSGGRISSANDRDCDGASADVDCNDNDPSVRPSATEVCGNGIDDNCNGAVDEIVDSDGDGFTNCDDCNEHDSAIHPGASEVCDGLDNDCDGTCDAEFDSDGDRFTTCGSKIKDGGAFCEDVTAEAVDCDDTNPLVYPEADELCDGADNDCDGSCDELFDPDGDLFTDCGSRLDVCNDVKEAYVDCAPQDGEVYPDSAEFCDGKDNNCDGILYDSTVQCYVMARNSSGVEVCAVGTRSCADGGTGWTGGCVAIDPNDETKTVDPAVCTAYDMCFADPKIADPAACAL
jgi:hypothetical protein